MNGIPSTREACALRVFISGLKPNASRAADGRRIRSGMRIDGISLLSTQMLRIK